MIVWLILGCRSEPTDKITTEEPILYEDTADNSTEDTSTTTTDSPLDTGDTIIDADNDGSPASLDCDDANPRVSPNHPELCNDTVDSNCDGELDWDKCDLSISLGHTIEGSVQEGGFARQATVIPVTSNTMSIPFETVLVSANFAESGRVYAFPKAQLLNTTQDTDATVQWTTERAQMYGTLIVTATTRRHSDLNGDGQNDLVITSPSSPNSVGQVHIYNGPFNIDEPPTIAHTSLFWSEDPDVGRSLELIDWNNDNMMDIIVGNNRFDGDGIDSGAIKIHISNTNGGLIDLNTDLTIQGENTTDLFGTTIRNLGDLNGDGLDDIAVSSLRAASSTGTHHAGRVYLFMSPLTDITSLEHSTHIFEGASEFEYLGQAIQRIGDINGDGIEDIAISSDGLNGKGRVYIVSGNTTNWCTTCSIQDVSMSTLIGEEEGDGFGRNFLALGDVNEDGFDDFAVGTKNANVGALDTGAVYIYYGPLSGPYDAQYHTRVSGDVESAQISISMNTITIDDDTLPDLLIGGRMEAGLVDEGRLHIVLGKDVLHHE